MYAIKKDKLIEPTGWEIVPLDYKGKDAIVVYIGGIIPCKVVNTGLTQEQFDRLYPAI